MPYLPEIEEGAPNQSIRVVGLEALQVLVIDNLPKVSNGLLLIN